MFLPLIVPVLSSLLTRLKLELLRDSGNLPIPEYVLYVSKLLLIKLLFLYNNNLASRDSILISLVVLAGTTISFSKNLKLENSPAIEIYSNTGEDIPR